MSARTVRRNRTQQFVLFAVKNLTCRKWAKRGASRQNCTASNKLLLPLPLRPTTVFVPAEKDWTSPCSRKDRKLLMVICLMCMTMTIMTMRWLLHGNGDALSLSRGSYCCAKNGVVAPNSFGRPAGGTCSKSLLNRFWRVTLNVVRATTNITVWPHSFNAAPKKRTFVPEPARTSVVPLFRSINGSTQLLLCKRRMVWYYIGRLFITSSTLPYCQYIAKHHENHGAGETASSTGIATVGSSHTLLEAVQIIPCAITATAAGAQSTSSCGSVGLAIVAIR